MKERENDDLRFVKEAAKTQTADLPGMPAQEEIEALITGKKQKRNTRPLRAVISVAVAACVLLTSVVAFRDLVYAPAVLRRQIDGAGTAVDYKTVGKLISARHSAEARGFGLFSKNAAMDMAVAEEAAGVEGDGAGAYGGMTMASAQNTEASTAAHAETNVRTAGVLESDVIKTDGQYLYLLSGDGAQLLIIDPMGRQREVARIDLKSGNEYRYTNEFYLLENRLLVLGGFYDASANKSCATVRFFDITDPAAPAETRCLNFDGFTVSSRVVGQKLMLVTTYYPDTGHFKPTDYTTFVPSYCEEGKTACYTAEENLCLGASGTETGFVTVSLLDLAAADAAPQSVSVFGSGGDIYCSGDNLYVYDAVYPAAGVFFGAREDTDEGVKTCIQKYDVSGDIAVCTATGQVEGYIGDGFALDETDGYLRVAAGDWNENRVYVLDGDLKTVGVSAVLAQGESIRSVRFMGRYAYVVTFRQTDPLFVLDLSDPTAPALTGEVKLPGFSSYLHPAGENLLLGLGYGGTEEGLDGSAKISLFDVSDPARPQETDSLVFKDLDLNLNYKAFVTLPDGSFLIPYVACHQQWIGAGANVEGENAPTEPVPETEATVSAVPETAAAAEEPATAETSTAAEEPATAETSTTAAVYAEDPIIDEYVYYSHPGLLHVKAENGRLVLLSDLTGEEIRDRWPDARASFIGDAGFLVSNDWQSIVVERFSLSSGEKQAAATYETGTEEYSYITAD